jgi:uncharacterized membrane protein YczE
VLPRPPAHELRRRLPRLMVGLVVFGLGIAFMVRSDLGLGPWDVLHQGVTNRTGIPIGTVGIIVGVLLLVTFPPLKERMGIGTIANTFVIGIVIDLTLLVMPEVGALVLRIVLMVAGILMIAVGSGWYIGSGLGPGPRDGLMTGIARLGPSIRVVRTGIEVSVLVLGWLLGGTVGVGTVLFAVTIGPLVQLFLERLSLPGLDAARPWFEPPAEPGR